MATFYENYVELCHLRGEKPTPTANKIGFSSAAVVKWKRGSLPSDVNLRKIAEYFNISVSELTGEATPLSPAPDASPLQLFAEKEQKESPTVNGEAISDKDILMHTLSTSDDEALLWEIADVINARLKELRIKHD